MRRLHGRWMLLLIAVGTMATAGGCGGKGRVSVSPVRGKVVYNGQGVAGTTVVFIPVDPANDKAQKLRPFAYGQNDGQFEIKTYKTGDGAPPGKYRVAIIVPQAGGQGSMKDQPVTAESAAPRPVVKVPLAIVRKYAKADTSGLEVTIQEGENNLDPFVLTMGAGPAAASSVIRSSQN